MDKGGIQMADTENKKEAMTKTSFRLSVEEKEALEKFAEENDLYVAQVIRRACKEYIDKYKGA